MDGNRKEYLLTNCYLEINNDFISFLNIAGILYDHLKSYTIVFLCSGAPPIIGAVLMCGIYCIKDKKDAENTDNNI